MIPLARPAGLARPFPSATFPALFARSLAPLLLLTASACDRGTPLRDHPAPHADPALLPCASVPSVPPPVAFILYASPVPPDPDPFPRAPRRSPLSPDDLARIVRDRFHRPTFLYPEPDGFTLVIVGSTPLLDPADRPTRQALSAHHAGRFARDPLRPVTLLLFSSRGDYDSRTRERYGPSGADLSGFHHPGRPEVVIDGSGGAVYLPTRRTRSCTPSSRPTSPTPRSGWTRAWARSWRRRPRASTRSSGANHPGPSARRVSISGGGELVAPRLDGTDSTRRPSPRGDAHPPGACASRRNDRTKDTILSTARCSHRSRCSAVRTRRSR